DGSVLTLHETHFLQALPKCTHKRSRIVERSASKERDYRYRLLRACRERPRGRRAAEQDDELAARHSITSSARASSVAGTSRPSALAGFRFIASSNLTGDWPGSSLGFSPLRMRSA